MGIARYFRWMTPGAIPSAPAVPALSMSDNGNGTGGTATIVGSTPGATNTLYYVPFANGNWTAAGSRVGDGTITTTIQGNYCWFVVSVLSRATSWSNLVSQALTNLNDQVPTRILRQVLADIQNLGLSGLPSANVVEKWLPRIMQGVDAVPTIMVCPGTKENYPNILTGKDDIGIPVLIAILDNQQENFIQNLPLYLNWRWLILSKFRFQPLPGVPEVLICNPEPTPILDKEQWKLNILCSPIMLRFITRTVRG